MRRKIIFKESSRKFNMDQKKKEGKVNVSK